jgi:hypothetical protein
MTDNHNYTPSTIGPASNTSVYIVYVEATENHAGGIYHTTCDLNEARTIAQGCAKDYPGCQIHIATRISTFRAETVVKEV